jgi:hypothetical protein
MLGESMHGHPDGLAFAVTDNAQPVAGADAPHDIEIGQRVTWLWLLVAAGFAMTLFSAIVACDQIGRYDATIGCSGILLFGLVTCRLIWMLPAGRWPVVVVTSYGIRDLRIGNEFLPWDSIADVSAQECRGHRAIVLTPSPALLRQLSCIRVTPAGAPADCIVIRPEGLTTDFDTLLRACRDCHVASGSRTALRRDRDHGAQAPSPQILAAQAS